MPIPAIAYFERHPILRETVLWAIPALLFGTMLRALLVSYLPYAFWGADSRSYFSFAHQWIANHDISLDEKRRYLYPLLMLPVGYLPGSPLRWLAIIQHTLGVATLLPLAYVVRRTLSHWRLWIVPVTVLYAGLPVIVWYEHELLGENVFFAALLWAFGGWVAWISERRPARSLRLFWFFFVPFAAFLLTKPSGRFVWPGITMGFVMVAAWRRLDWTRWAWLVALAAATLTVGSKKQGAWLLYTAAFPLTQLDTLSHFEYKAEIRDLVEPLSHQIDTYYLFDDQPFEILRTPGEQDTRLRWKALGNDSRKRSAVYLDLALEGIEARPVTFAYFGLQRIAGSANLSAFGLRRFDGASFRERTEHFYAEGERDPSNRVRLAFGLPRQGSVMPYAEFANRLDPAPHSWSARTVQACVAFFGRSLDFVRFPNLPKAERKITLARPTLLGCWLFCGAALSFLPAYRRTLGVWTLVAGGYLFGVFLVSQTNARYFAPAWLVIVPLLAVPADVLVSLVLHFWTGDGQRGEHDGREPSDSIAHRPGRTVG